MITLLASEDFKAELEKTNAGFNSLRVNFEEIKLELKKAKLDLKQLDEKHTKTCVQLKRLQSEKEDLDKEGRSMNVAMKALTKESKNSQFEHDKIVKIKDDAIQELLEYKVIKTSEEKLLKNKAKKLEKRLKAVEERGERKVTKVSDIEAHGEMKTIDDNQNETSSKSEEITSVAAPLSIPAISIKNCFEALESDVKVITRERLQSLTASTTTTPATPAVNSCSETSHKRIQCDQCARKCVDKEDMEHHLLLWHSDPLTFSQFMKTKQKTT